MVYRGGCISLSGACSPFHRKVPTKPDGIAVLLTSVMSVHAQERIAAGPPPNGPAFDAVSIKRNVNDVID